MAKKVKLTDFEKDRDMLGPGNGNRTDGDAILSTKDYGILAAMTFDGKIRLFTHASIEDTAQALRDIADQIELDYNEGTAP